MPRTSRSVEASLKLTGLFLTNISPSTSPQSMEVIALVPTFPRDSSCSLGKEQDSRALWPLSRHKYTSVLDDALDIQIEWPFTRLS